MSVRWAAGSLLLLVGLAAPTPAWAATEPHSHGGPRPTHAPKAKPTHAPKTRHTKPTPRPRPTHSPKAQHPTPTPSTAPAPTPTALPQHTPAAHLEAPVPPRPAVRHHTVRHARVAPPKVTAPVARHVAPALRARTAVRPTSLTQALSKPAVLAPALRRNASVPVALLVALVLFLFVQGRIDRRDPKLRQATTGDDELVFSLPKGVPQPVRRSTAWSVTPIRL